MCVCVCLTTQQPENGWIRDIYEIRARKPLFCRAPLSKIPDIRVCYRFVHFQVPVQNDF